MSFGLPNPYRQAINIWDTNGAHALQVFDTATGLVSIFNVNSDDPTIDCKANTFAIYTTAGALKFLVDAGSSITTHNTGQVIKRTVVADANYTALTSDYIIAYTTCSTTRTVALPAAATCAGQMFIVKDESGSVNGATITITVDPAGAETIDGGATKVIITAYGTLTIYSNGTNWFTTARFL